ncbi:MAG: DUF4282 domain-containing protein [Kocuria sp.]|nr:DUF4282 domain-containing protein [Kocuria sp.]
MSYTPSEPTNPYQEPQQPAPQGAPQPHYSGYGYVPGQQGQPSGQPTGAKGSGEPNFFQTLFDISFKNFITIRFAGVLFIVGLTLIVLSWLMVTFAAFFDSALTGIIAFLFGAVITFGYVLLFRLTLEFYVATVRTAQNTTLLLEQSKR